MQLGAKIQDAINVEVVYSEHITPLNIHYPPEGVKRGKESDTAVSTMQEGGKSGNAHVTSRRLGLGEPKRG